MSDPMMAECCLGCNQLTAFRDCGCPAGTGMRPMSNDELKAEIKRLHGALAESEAARKKLDRDARRLLRWGVFYNEGGAVHSAFYNKADAEQCVAMTRGRCLLDLEEGKTSSVEQTTQPPSEARPNPAIVNAQIEILMAVSDKAKGLGTERGALYMAGWCEGRADSLRETIK